MMLLIMHYLVSLGKKRGETMCCFEQENFQGRKTVEKKCGSKKIEIRKTVKMNAPMPLLPQTT